MSLPSAHSQSANYTHAPLRNAHMESSDLIIGIDYTKSNTWQGERTFAGRRLHYISPDARNPYEKVIELVGNNLVEILDNDCILPCFRFGDTETRGERVLSIFEEGASTNHTIGQVRSCATSRAHLGPG